MVLGLNTHAHTHTLITHAGKINVTVSGDDSLVLPLHIVNVGKSVKRDTEWILKDRVSVNT